MIWKQEYEKMCGLPREPLSLRINPRPQRIFASRSNLNYKLFRLPNRHNRREIQYETLIPGFDGSTSGPSMVKKAELMQDVECEMS